MALLAWVSAGDRVLITDSVYGPTRHFADVTLKKLGVETVYYDPGIGADIASLITDTTTVVCCESPGSLTFEMQDLPAIAAAAHARNATVIFDNTWATPYYFRPLDHGADLSVMAATKYIAGHADVMLGTIAGNGAHIRRVRELHGSLGLHVGPDDMYLGLRGLRTLGIRLDRHWRSAVTVAEWLQRRPEVAEVRYPALRSDPGNALWRRDMTGASGLFGFTLKDPDIGRAKRFIDNLELFGIGASWGGFESLAILTHPKPARSVVPAPDGPAIRLHIGLDDPADLIADLDAAFAAAA
jgi:cystathionine beta-lyase